MIGVVSAIGSIVYLQVYGILYDTFPNAPWLSFACIALFDIVILAFLGIMIQLGKFEDVEPGTEEDELRGPDGGQGGYDDIPNLKENQEFIDQ